MSIEKISPRMQAALRDEKQLHFFGKLWLAVLNDSVDTKEDFEASVAQSNMDFTTVPGLARLEINAGNYTQTQTVHDAYFDASFLWSDFPGHWFFKYGGQAVFQSFQLSSGRILNSYKIRVDNTAAPASSVVKIKIISNLDQTGAHRGKNAADWFSYTTHHAYEQTVTTAFNGDIVVSNANVQLDAGKYWIMVESGSWHHPTGVAYAARIRATSTNPYADGQVEIGTRHESITISPSYGIYYQDRWVTWTYQTGYDLYFDLSFSGYVSEGSFTTRTLDLLEVPREPGTFQMAYQSFFDTVLNITLYGSATGAFSGEETAYSLVDDGFEVPAFRYWRIRADLYANLDLNKSPSIDLLEIVYPSDELCMRVRGTALRHVSESILKKYQPLLSPPAFTMSEIKIIERIATGGTIDLELKDTGLDAIQRIVSGSPLKNYRGILYLGADVPGFDESDLLRFFIGMVDTGSVKPKYRGEFYSLKLTCKNPILELTRKVPIPSNTGQLDMDASAISYDGDHVMDAMLDLMRGQAGIPSRYVNTDTFLNAKNTIGDADLSPSAHVVYRSNAAGLVDTRLKSPEEVRKHLAALATIADGYIVPDESSRIMFVKHDAAALAEEIWADEDMVRSGEITAVPIEGVDEIKLGYDDFLYNCAILGATWDGSGGDWKAFASVYANVDSDSAEEWAPGKATFVSIMEKNMVEVSKWLGPDSSGYNGDTIAQALTARFVARFGYPPLRLQGVTVRISEFMRTLGSVVQVHSREIAKFRRRGIASSESVKFLITGKSYDAAKNKMKFNLMELT